MYYIACPYHPLIMKVFLLFVLFVFSLPLGLSAQATLAQAETSATAYVKTKCIQQGKGLFSNVWLGNDKRTIHIFMFEDGNFILGGLPTTATEDNLYQFHLFVSNSTHKAYRLEVAGTYEPTLLQEDKSLVGRDRNNSDSIKSKPLDFAVVGPYSNTVTFTLKSSDNGTDFGTTVIATSMHVAKRIYASIGSGFVRSFISNPTNIHGAKMANGDSTLLADSPRGDISLTIGATLYPWGRDNLMLPKSLLAFKDRVGILIATNIASSTAAMNFKNVYVGLQYDFAPGGSIITGLDVNTKRQRIYGVDYSSFTFGETKFTGKVMPRLYTETAYGFFAGIQVDSRIFAKIFKGNP